VLDRDCADVAAAIDVKLRILVQIPSLGDVPSLELDVERVGVTEILDLHGSNERSKEALCTVSPSASKITRSISRPSLRREPIGGCDRQPASFPSPDA
jgi:hypothetical protein